jgi:predicted membrane-bound spermidine synthase
VHPSLARLPAPIVTVFFASGFASLIYQVAWQRLLTLYYGVGPVSITLIVSVYMLGLGFGSLAGGRLAARRRDPYAAYAAVQGALGAAGLATLPCMAALASATAVGSPLLQMAALFAILCVPTLLMGMTLPIVVDLVTRRNPDFVGSVSRLYFANTLGAACGALAAGFVLISLLGLDGCIVFAAVIDLTLAAVVLRVRPAEVAAPAEKGSQEGDAPAGLRRLAYPLVFVAGFMAVGYEIVWYRVIGVLVKDSPYAFASVLAVFLLGIALGSRAIDRYVTQRPRTNRAHAFFTLQFLIGAAVLLTFIGYHQLSAAPGIRSLVQTSFLADLHPSPGILLRSPGLHSVVDAYLLLDVFLWSAVFMLVPTILMGASFPLIASVALSRRGGEGQAVGATYFFGVLGNVLGGLLTGLVLLPALGSETTVLLFGITGVLFGVAPLRLAGGVTVPGRLSPAWRVSAVVALVTVAALAFPRPGALYRAMHVAPFSPSQAYVREGRDGVVVTYVDRERVRNFINGQGHGYRPGPVFLAEAFAALSHADSPRRILVIGFGAGTISEAALMTGEAERITVVELSGTLLDNLRTLPAAARLLDHPVVRVVVGDGRQYLQRSGETFDAILMDPLRTTTAYSNNLHSVEFFALAARRLAPDGVLMVGGLDGGPIVPRTLLAEFPHVRAYPFFCLAAKRPLHMNQARFDRMLEQVSEEHRGLIRDVSGDTLEDEALARATAGAPVNRDWRPASEYYLWALLMNQARALARR